MRYQVKRVLVQTKADEENLDEILNEGWEPFTVTLATSGYYIYHLRQRVERT